jgi:hypothetical protein
LADKAILDGMARLIHPVPENLSGLELAAKRHGRRKTLLAFSDRI